MNVHTYKMYNCNQIRILYSSLHKDQIKLLLLNAMNNDMKYTLKHNILYNLSIKFRNDSLHYSIVLYQSAFFIVH